jgi:hypothetical protein
MLSLDRQRQGKYHICLVASLEESTMLLSVVVFTTAFKFILDCSSLWVVLLEALHDPVSSKLVLA